MNKLTLTVLTLIYTFAFAYFGPVGITLPSFPGSGAGTGAASSEGTAFRLPAAGGGEIDLAAYAGKPVLLMFFTESCPYCRKAGPALEKLHKAYGPGLNVLGVCIEDGPDAALNFGKALSISFPLAYGGQEVFRRYRAQGVPYIYLLDRGHRVYDVWEGYDESYDPMMKNAVENLLTGK